MSENYTEPITMSWDSLLNPPRDHYACIRINIGVQRTEREVKELTVKENDWAMILDEESIGSFNH